MSTQHSLQPTLPAEPASRLDRRDAILAAAFEEFAAKGYAEARLEDVAQRAGIAKGTIYLHFKNKEVLFRAVLRGTIHQSFEEIDAFVESFAGSAAELMSIVVSRQYADIVRNSKARSMLRLLIAESHKFPELAEVYLREVITPGIAAIRILIEKGIASGEFRRTNITEFPQLVVAPALLAVVWALILDENCPLNLDQYMKAHLELVLCGLKNTGSAAGEEGDHVTGEKTS